jgi:hypothetical protein
LIPRNAPDYTEHQVSPSASTPRHRLSVRSPAANTLRYSPASANYGEPKGISRGETVAAAQVHAALALPAATALGTAHPVDESRWRRGRRSKILVTIACGSRKAPAPAISCLISSARYPFTEGAAFLQVTGSRSAQREASTGHRCRSEAPLNGHSSGFSSSPSPRLLPSPPWAGGRPDQN